MAAHRDIPDEVDWPAGWSVRSVESTGSTNDDLLRDAEAGGLADRVVLIAAHQHAGRGRLDRTWEAPPSANLLASIHFAEVPSRPAEITQRVGLAIVAATTDVPMRDRRTVRLKWPNDVMYGTAKLAGVLAQRSGRVPGVVVGFGVNVGWAPPGAAWLHDPGGLDSWPQNPLALLAEILRSFDALPADIDALYRDRLSTIGQQVRVLLPGGREQLGRATGVTTDGALVVVDDRGGERTYDVGDVIHLRPV